MIINYEKYKDSFQECEFGLVSENYKRNFPNHSKIGELEDLLKNITINKKKKETLLEHFKSCIFKENIC